MRRLGAQIGSLHSPHRDYLPEMRPISWEFQWQPRRAPWGQERAEGPNAGPAEFGRQAVASIAERNDSAAAALASSATSLRENSSAVPGPRLVMTLPS